MSISLQAVLDETFQHMGINAEHCTPENWRAVSDELLIALELWITESVSAADDKLGHNLAKRVKLDSHGWRDPSFWVGQAILRPPDAFFLREDQPWRQPPKVGNGGSLYITAELQGARPAHSPDMHLSPVVYLKLHIGYEACEPLKWLIVHWRRLLEKLLLPLKPEVILNGHENEAVKAFRGKDVVKKAELYLSDPGKDPVVTFELMLFHRTTEEEARRAVAVCLAVYDAIYSLQVPRCDADRLHRHFLILESELPNLPFRGGFYDPGQTQREMIEEWDRTHPDDKIPLG